MSYNPQSPSQLTYLHTAGKITILTMFLGVAVFALTFLLNVGHEEITKVEAQSTASTSVNVLNTPPDWNAGFEGREDTESSTSTPTNSGDTVTWIGTAIDANGADYYMLICSGTSTPAEPTANPNAAPDCASGQVQWGVSLATNSGTESTVSTTTIDRSSPSAFAESNVWYAWICDADPVNPRCNSTYSTGTAATNSSPFYVNSRPNFSGFWDDSPADPSALVTFHATASDADTVTEQDTVQLWVCNEADFGTGTSTVECGPGGTIASSTLAASDPTAAYTLPAVIQDQDYTAYGYIIDVHGHAAIGGSQGSNSILSVNNVAPTAENIILNDGNDLILTNAATQTPNFSLTFTARDNNSCENAATTDEVINYALSVFRSGVGTTSCDTAGEYDANNCYPSQVGAATWNLSCAATTTASDCTGSTDATQTWECTFPLWYVADPTDDGATSTPWSAEDWRAAVSPVDDDNATGTFSQSNTANIDVRSLLAFALDTALIPYGDLEPGTDTGTLSASTTVRATGNVGLDQELAGESMCITYDSSNPCPVSATSTIPENQQEFGTTSLAYGQGINLSSTTIQELELNVQKSTSTTIQAAGATYWGIAVPGTITLAGLYTGENTFYAKLAEPADW